MSRIISAIFIIALITNACKKADPVPPVYSWSYAYADTSIFEPLITTLGVFAPKPVPSASTIVPDSGMLSSYVPYRLNTTNISVVGTLTGVTMDQVPVNFLKMLTLNNPPLTAVGLNTSVSGWLVQDVFALYPNGSARSVSTQLPDSLSISLSVMITFFPDGYYSIINNRDSTRNNWGWYQIVTNDTLPKAIIYNTFGYGPDLTGLVTRPVPNQAFGIWGIDKNSFYPLLQLDSYTTVFLKTTPQTY